MGSRWSGFIYWAIITSNYFHERIIDCRIRDVHVVVLRKTGLEHIPLLIGVCRVVVFNYHLVFTIRFVLKNQMNPVSEYQFLMYMGWGVARNWGFGCLGRCTC